ncbi:MAG: hypothetical protein ACTSVY_15295 [Candidatus Helarchaeota archaeon]
MGNRLEKIIEGGMTVKEYIRLVKIILEFIKIDGISIRYVSMLFRIIGDEMEMDDFPDELFDIHDEFQMISGELEIPTTTIDEFIKKIEKLLEKIESS